MKSEYLGQTSFSFFNAGRQQETIELVQDNMELFHIIARIIETSKEQFENRIKDAKTTSFDREKDCSIL